MDNNHEKLFHALKDKAVQAGVTEEQLRTAISEADEGDIGAIVKKLGMTLSEPAEADVEPGTGTNKHAEKFTGDRLYGEKAPLTRRSLRDFSVDPNTLGPRTTVQKTKPNTQGQLFPPGSNLLKSSRDKKRELDAAVNRMQKEVPKQAGEIWTFPSTEHDFNMMGAVQTSIRNFRKAKAKFRVVKPNEVGTGVFSPIRNQLF